MYRCVIFFIININLFVQSVPSFVNENYNIRINLKISKYGNNYDLNETFVVLRDKPFNITFVDYASAGIVCHTLGRYPYSKPVTRNIEMTRMLGLKWNSVIKVRAAEEYMSAKWKCTFGRRNETDQIVTFNIRVKGRPKIKVTVGGVELNKSLSEWTELTYDHIAYYWYEDGETIDLVCHHLIGGFLSIVYYDQSGRKLIETDRIFYQKPRGIQNFQKTMHTSDNNYIIDCKHNFKYNNQQDYTFRIIFKLRPEDSMSNKLEDSLDIRMEKINLLEVYKYRENTEDYDEALANFKNRYGPVKFQRVAGTKITVNSLKIIPTNVSAHLDKEEYQYMFFDGQILNVTCEKNKDLPGHLDFGSDNNEHLKFRILEERNDNFWKKTITLDTKNMTLEHLRCEVIGYTTANIMLALDPKELYVLGLPANNIMYQYQNDSSTWIVEYQYTVDRTLNLTCGARTERDLRWIFGNTTTQAVLKSKNLHDVFTMQADHNEMKIICEGKSNNETMKVIINLHCMEIKKEDIWFTIAPKAYFDRSDAITTYAVFENQPFNITLLSHNETRARCSRYYNDLYNFPTKHKKVVKKDKSISVIMVSTASEDMSTIWKCSLTKRGSSVQDVRFRIQVICINNVNVTIGGIEQKAVVLNSSDEVYDAVSHYWYEVGEAIDFKCVNRHVGGTIQLRYYDANSTKLIETDQLWQAPIKFRKTMHVSNDGDSIDCIYQMEYYIFTYRTVFKLKSEFSSKRAIGVYVNDIRLVPISASYSNMNIYEYKYHKGESLTVACEKDKSAPGFVQFESNDIAVPESNKRSRGELRNKDIVQLNTKHLNQKHLTCNLISNELTSIADIRFLAETKQLYIIGLSMSDMIFQYKKNISTWVLDYNCVQEHVVLLTCVAIAESDMRWIYTNDFAIPDSSGEFYNETTSISHKFALRPEVKVMTITCEAIDIQTIYLQRIVVNLHRVRKSSKTPETGQDPGIHPEESLDSKVIVIISFAMAMLVSVFGISIACSTFVKRKNKIDKQNTTTSNRLQSRPLPEVPRQRQPLYCYNYVYSSSDYADLELDEIRNENLNQQNTMYYWVFE